MPAPVRAHRTLALVSPVSVALAVILALPATVAPTPAAKFDRLSPKCLSCAGAAMRIERSDDADAGITVLMRVPISYRGVPVSAF